MIEIHKLTACGLPKAPAITSHRTVTAAVHVETQPGNFMHITLDERGILIARGEDQVRIPLDELVTLAVMHEPRLALVELMVEGEPINSFRPRPTDDLTNK